MKKKKKPFNKGGLGVSSLLGYPKKDEKSNPFAKRKK